MDFFLMSLLLNSNNNILNSLNTENTKKLIKK